MKIAGISYCPVPAGEVLIGTPEQDPLAFSDEFPQHRVSLPYDYWLAKYPVTNIEFSEFAKSTNYVTQAEKQGWAFVFNVDEMAWEKVESGAGLTLPG